MKKWGIGGIRAALAPLSLFLLFTSFCGNAYANEVFARETARECEACHVGDPAELEFTDTGNAFVENYYKWPEKKEEAPPPPSNRTRRMAGGVHAVTAVAFLGMLAYGYFPAALGGRMTERRIKTRRIVWGSVIFVLGTGSFLLTRIDFADNLLGSRAGFLLWIKVILFSVLSFTLAYQDFTVEPRLLSAEKAATSGNRGAADALKWLRPRHARIAGVMIFLAAGVAGVAIARLF